MSTQIQTYKPLWLRLCQYTSERFPLAKHGLLIAAFAAAGMTLSSTMRGASALPDLASYGVCLFTTVSMFYMLRIADEFKDHEDDCKWRPYLPVPRGLVTLDELGRCFAVLPVIQLALNLWLCPPLALALLLIWSYIFLMSNEFFAREWLRKQPVAYLLSHMLIVPLVDIYITACDWLVRAPGHSLAAAPSALWIFVVLSFFNGLILEVGRKIRSSAEEETGVETYSVLWGKKNALAVWMGLLLGATGTAVCLANTLACPIAFIGAAVLSLIATFFAGKVWLDDREPCGPAIENISGLFVLIVYLSVGFVPLLSGVMK